MKRYRVRGILWFVVSYGATWFTVSLLDGKPIGDTIILTGISVAAGVLAHAVTRRALRLTWRGRTLTVQARAWPRLRTQRITDVRTVAVEHERIRFGVWFRNASGGAVVVTFDAREDALAFAASAQRRLDALPSPHKETARRLGDESAQ